MNNGSHNSDDELGGAATPEVIGDPETAASVAPSTSSRRPRRLGLELGVIGVIGALFLGALGAGGVVLYREMYSPTAFVLRYLDLLSEGRAADALQMHGVAIEPEWRLIPPRSTCRKLLKRGNSNSPAAATAGLSGRCRRRSADQFIWVTAVDRYRLDRLQCRALRTVSVGDCWLAHSGQGGPGQLVLEGAAGCIVFDLVDGDFAHFEVALDGGGGLVGGEQDVG